MAQEITGRTVDNQEMVETDGCRFTNCTFNSAVLVYRGGEHPSFDSCIFGQDVTWRFLGPALATVQFLQRIANDTGGEDFIGALFKKGVYFEE